MCSHSARFASSCCCWIIGTTRLYRLESCTRRSRPLWCSKSRSGPIYMPAPSLLRALLDAATDIHNYPAKLQISQRPRWMAPSHSTRACPSSSMPMSPQAWPLPLQPRSGPPTSPLGAAFVKCACPADAFLRYAWNSDASVLEFIQDAPSSVHYFFTSYGRERAYCMSQ
jgi:hypothetical protein